MKLFNMQSTLCWTGCFLICPSGETVASEEPKIKIKHGKRLSNTSQFWGEQHNKTLEWVFFLYLHFFNYAFVFFFLFGFDILLTLTFYRFKIYFLKKSLHSSWHYSLAMPGKVARRLSHSLKSNTFNTWSLSCICFILHPVCSAVLYSVAVICSGGRCLNSMTSECSIAVVTVVECQFACIRPVEEASLVSQMKITYSVKKRHILPNKFSSMWSFLVLNSVCSLWPTAHIKRLTAVSLQTICFLFAQFLIIWYWQMA